MKIKGVKKVKNLKKDDVISIGIEDQQDAGVYSDITEPNVIMTVDRVTRDKKTVTIRTNGGYEFTYPKHCIIFYLGSHRNLRFEASILYSKFDQDETPVKEINKFIAAVRQEQKTEKFAKSSLN